MPEARKHQVSLDATPTTIAYLAVFAKLFYVAWIGILKHHINIVANGSEIEFCS